MAKILRQERPTLALKVPTAEIFVPDCINIESALARTTHMGIAAHQDDVEMLAFDGIVKCFGKSNQFFFGVTLTNGAGTPRDGMYADLTEDEIVAVRRKEQKKAAVVGEYGALALLDYPSTVVKSAANQDPVDDIKVLVEAARPNVVYTHVPTDRHDTHVAVGLRVIRALQELPVELRPEHLYGIEGVQDNDWMIEGDKIYFDVSGHDSLANALIEVFDSQHCGAKRWDQAVTARRQAHAVFARYHSPDTWTQVIYGMDLTPLLNDTTLSITEYVLAYIERFKNDVVQRIARTSSNSNKLVKPV